MKAPEATIDLGRGWTNSMFKRLGYSIRHATTGKLQLPGKYVAEKQYTFLRDIALPVRRYSIDRSLIINWDQTPLQYAPTGQWTMEKTGESKVAINGMAVKRNITAVLSVALDETTDLHRPHSKISTYCPVSGKFPCNTECQTLVK